MTIFLELVKVYLDEELRGIEKASERADNSMTNGLTSWFGWGRNERLSKAKRGLVGNLLNDIKQLEDLESDYHTQLRIIDLILDCKEKARRKSIEAGEGEGSTSKKMDKVKLLVGNFYLKLKEIEKLTELRNILGDLDDPRSDLIIKKPIQLLDIPHDNHPLNQFRYHMTHYLFQKVFEESHPKWITNVKLAREKETHILAALYLCEQGLEKFNKQLDDYPITCQNKVIESIAKLKIHNKELCKNYRPTKKMPVLSIDVIGTINIDTSQAGPKPGFLKDCLKYALEEVRRNARVPNKVSEERPQPHKAPQMFALKAAKVSAALMASEVIEDYAPPAPIHSAQSLENSPTIIRMQI